MSLAEKISYMPLQQIQVPVDIPQLFNPYGGAGATNPLEYFLGTPDIETKVLKKEIKHV